MSPLYRNQSINWVYKSLNWFLYDKNIEHQRVNVVWILIIAEELFLENVFSDVVTLMVLLFTP